MVINCKIGMKIRINSSPTIPKPHIRAIMSKDTRGRLIIRGIEPGAGYINESMLKEYWCAFQDVAGWVPDSPEVEDVAVGAGYVVLLVGEAVGDDLVQWIHLSVCWQRLRTSSNIFQETLDNKGQDIENAGLLGSDDWL